MKPRSSLIELQLLTLSKDALIAMVLDMRRQLGCQDAGFESERNEVDEQLAVLRSCTDSHCQLCNRCVVALFIKAHPLPLTIPKKYVEAPWRK